VPYQDKLIYSSLLLPCFFLVLLLPPAFAHFGLKDKVEKSWDYFYFSIFFITFSAYPAVSRNILSTFACAQLGADGHFLRSDMRMLCPGRGDFATVWAIVFTCLIPAGVPLILVIVLVAHRVPGLARKKHSSSLLEGFLNTYKKELSEAAISELLKVLKNASPSEVEEWLQFSERTSAWGTDTISDKAELRKALSAVLKYTYPFGEGKSTIEELMRALGSHKRTLEYISKSDNLTLPQDKNVVFNLLAFAVRKLGHNARLAAANSQPLHPTLYRASKQSLDNTEIDNTTIHNIFGVSVPSNCKVRDPDTYLSLTQKLNLLNGSTLNEMTRQLFAQAELMLSAKLLSLKQPSWNAAEPVEESEKKIVERLGFLFQSYKPEVWYFEIIEMIRKLVMASILLFIYEGTASQIIIGFIVTLVSLLLSLWLQPFSNEALQRMHQWSLLVQALTLLSGVMISTEQFIEILGEKGGKGIDALGGLLVFFHAFVTVTPLFDQAAKKLFNWLRMTTQRSLENRAGSETLELDMIGFEEERALKPEGQAATRTPEDATPLTSSAHSQLAGRVPELWTDGLTLYPPMLQPGSHFSHDQPVYW
jgi:hypothetical protein